MRAWQITSRVSSSLGTSSDTAGLRDQGLNDVIQIKGRVGPIRGLEHIGIDVETDLTMSDGEVFDGIVGRAGRFGDLREFCTAWRNKAETAEAVFFDGVAVFVDPNVVGSAERA